MLDTDVGLHGVAELVVCDCLLNCLDTAPEIDVFLFSKNNLKSFKNIEHVIDSSFFDVELLYDVLEVDQPCGKVGVVA